MTRVLVTGYGGFLGKAIALQALARGWQVRGVARSSYGDMVEAGVEPFPIDLAAATPGSPAGQMLAGALQGVDVAFHVAAKAGVWGSRREYADANIEATRHLLDACRASAVGRLVFTSSPSVAFDGRDHPNADESLPYPARYLADYPETKAAAEKMVLAAESPSFHVVALRPHLIWGPGDPHIAPRLVARSRAGRLRRVGNGRNAVDATYIDDAAHAHLLAADALLANPESVGGKPYFISSGQPLPLWQLIDRILEACGAPLVPKLGVPAGLAYAAGAVLEAAYMLAGVRREPPMTRFMARELSTAHWFNLSAATRDFGYEPRVTIDEGLARLKEWWARQPA